jgi:phosphate transport system permease protein
MLSSGPAGGPAGNESHYVTTIPVPGRAAEPPSPRKVSRKPTGGDAVFVHGFRTIGASVLVITGGIGVFLAIQSLPTLRHYGPDFFSVHQGWNFDTDQVSVASLLVGTVEVALIAISIAFPLALATALYISEYAPPGLKATLVAAIDLMAAVPSIVYGLWGRDLVQPHASTVAMFVDRHFGGWAVHGNALTFLLVVMFTSAAIWLVLRFAAQIKDRWAQVPLYLALVAAVALVPVCLTVNADPNAANLAPEQSSFQKSAFVAGIAVAMMVLPMACAIMRQVFSQTPPGEKEAALALGSTKWGMIRAVVLPFGKGGIIGGTMLGLGRALGETIAVLLIINQVFEIKPNVLQTGTATVSSTIAAQFGEATGIQLKALLTAGFVLFVLTLIVNTLAAIVVNRSRSGNETA